MEFDEMVLPRTIIFNILSRRSRSSVIVILLYSILVNLYFVLLHLVPHILEFLKYPQFEEVVALAKNERENMEPGVVFH